MSQSARNNAAKVFQSEIGLFLVYLLVRTAPLVAVVFYFTTVTAAVVVAIVLLAVLLWAARRNNHQFILHSTSLAIKTGFGAFGAPISYSYHQIQQAAVKLANRHDKRQWLALQDQTGRWKKYRCDWLHQQDPPSVDEHDDNTPQHELFDLLDEEDFYEGSIQQMAFLLQKKGIFLQLAAS